MGRTPDQLADTVTVSGRDDAGAFTAWVRPHWDVMRRVAERLVGRDMRDDVLQEALIAAWRRHETYDADRGTPRAWLVAITANEARRFHRREAGRGVPLDVDHIDRATGREADGMRVDVDRAIASLPARQRLAVDLSYFADLSITDVAACLGCAEGTVRSALHSARSKIAAHLGKDYR